MGIAICVVEMWNELLIDPISSNEALFAYCFGVGLDIRVFVNFFSLKICISSLLMKLSQASLERGLFSGACNKETSFHNVWCLSSRKARNEIPQSFAHHEFYLFPNLLFT